MARQVGRPWNKVYAEIAAGLRVDSTVQQHVRDHLRDFVAVKPQRNISGRFSSLSSGLWWQDFYVDPRTGLLCRTDRLPEEKARLRARRNRPAPPVECVAVSPDRELRLIDGIWYEVRLAPFPIATYRATREIVTRSLVPWSQNSRTFEAEMEIRRLVSPPVQDVVEGTWSEVGASIDTPEAWKDYRRRQPRHTYAVVKRVLSRKELRQRGLCNRL